MFSACICLRDLLYDFCMGQHCAASGVCGWRRVCVRACVSVCVSVCINYTLLRDQELQGGQTHTDGEKRATPVVLKLEFRMCLL